VLGMVIVGGDY